MISGKSIKLYKGVQMHPFSDGSGCIFFDSFSGETVSIAASVDELEKLITQYHGLDEQNKLQNPLHSLFSKQFIQAEF